MFVMKSGADVLERRFADNFAESREWENHPYLTDPMEDIEVFLSSMPGQRMLDVGCGWGRYAHRFQEVQTSVEYLGIDSSQSMLNAAQESNPELSFRQMSYRDLKLQSQSFDGLWCCCVFGSLPKQHLSDTLHNLSKLLAPDGTMMVIHPFDGSSSNIISRDRNNQPILWHSLFAAGELETYLASSGFEIVLSTIRAEAGAQSILVKKS